MIRSLLQGIWNQFFKPPGCSDKSGGRVIGVSYVAFYFFTIIASVIGGWDTTGYLRYTILGILIVNYVGNLFIKDIRTFRFRYFPVFVFLCCLGCEYLVFKHGGPRLEDYGLIPTFVVFPLVSVFWVIYCLRKRPEVKIKTPFILFLWFIMIIVLPLTAPEISKITISSDNDNKAVFFASVMFGVFWLLILYQGWVLKQQKRSINKLETQGS